MIAVVIVRDGVLPAGFDETICEADRKVLLVGSGVSESITEVETFSRAIWTLDVDPSAHPAAEFAAVIVSALGAIDAVDEPVLLPSSPDGRDLAPHLAFALDRPFFAGATGVTADAVTMSRLGGLHLVDCRPRGAFVATLQIGVRGSEPRNDAVDGPATSVRLSAPEARSARVAPRSVEFVEVQPPDASTIDLAEAPRIIGGGAGLDDAAAFEQLHRISAALGASMGVTRVITDRGWAEHNRQIGTTGVVVDPRLYISFGISGAVQHTSGLGHPDHIISVNTDAHCPMMQMSDIAIVADANEVLDALEVVLADPDRSSAA